MNNEIGSNDGSSSASEETRLVKAFFEALNHKDPEALLKTLHPDIAYRFHIHGFDTVTGHAGMVEALHAIYAIFPDFHEDLLSLQLGGNLAVARWRITGSLAGPFPLPQSPAGFVIPEEQQAPVSVEGVDIFEIQDGLIRKKDTFADPTNWYLSYQHLAMTPKQDSAFTA